MTIFGLWNLTMRIRLDSRGWNIRTFCRPIIRHVFVQVNHCKAIGLLDRHGTGHGPTRDEIRLTLQTNTRGSFNMSCLRLELFPYSSKEPGGILKFKRQSNNTPSGRLPLLARLLRMNDQELIRRLHEQYAIRHRCEECTANNHSHHASASQVQCLMICSRILI